MVKVNLATFLVEMDPFVLDFNTKFIVLRDKLVKFWSQITNQNLTTLEHAYFEFFIQIKGGSQQNLVCRNVEC